MNPRGICRLYEQGFLFSTRNQSRGNCVWHLFPSSVLSFISSKRLLSVRHWTQIGDPKERGTGTFKTNTTAVLWTVCEGDNSPLTPCLLERVIQMLLGASLVSSMNVECGARKGLRCNYKHGFTFLKSICKVRVLYIKLLLFKVTAANFVSERSSEKGFYLYKVPLLAVPLQRPSDFHGSWQL